MPSRVVRGEINESASLSRVSLEADLAFRALLTVVDDFGRIDARPQILKAKLFPMRKEVTEALLQSWIYELTSSDGDSRGCIEMYEVEGRPFIQIVNWERHRGRGKRAQHSKYPGPPGSRSGPADDGIPF